MMNVTGKLSNHPTYPTSNFPLPKFNLNLNPSVYEEKKENKRQRILNETQFDSIARTKTLELNQQDINLHFLSL